MKFFIPMALQVRTKYGLLITDNDVGIVSWKAGEMERLAVFSNDDAGVARMLEFFTQNAGTFRDRPLHVLVNIIGEDYRFEKVAHLIGKYKTDFHSRRMQQLFRGSQFCVSEVQGREERGKREDWVLFSGVLTENKVLPWIQAAVRAGCYLAGVQMVSHMLSDHVLRAVGGNVKGNNLLITLHERSLLRQTLYINGHLRFSRVSKVHSESVEELSGSVKKELERTLQYLGSLKISTASGVKVRMIAPSDMVGQLRELTPSGDRVTFDFYDAAQIAQKIGLKTPVESLGADSSLPMHIMFSCVQTGQLAPVKLVTYYWSYLSAQVAIAVLLLYGINAYFTPLGYLTEGYENSSASVELTQTVNSLQRQYDAEVGAVVGEPPSSPNNMRAVSSFYTTMEDVLISPTQLLYFIGQGLRKNPGIQIDKVDWQVSSLPSGGGAIDDTIVSGNDIYQIAEIQGILLERGVENYRDVAARAKRLIVSLSGREDIYVNAIKVPSDTISTENLSGELSTSLDVEAPTSREFVLRIIWKAYDKEGFEKAISES